MALEHANQQSKQSQSFGTEGGKTMEAPDFSLTAGPLQLQSGQSSIIQKKPIIEHEANVGKGRVVTRSGDKYNAAYDNTYSLDYQGADADKAHWLQFVNFEMKATDPGTGNTVYNTGDVNTSSGRKPYSTAKVTNWSVDSASGTDPYYDAAGANDRTPKKGIKIFDAAGGASWSGAVNSFVTKDVPKATNVDFKASFCTFLVIAGQIKYSVAYSTSTKYTINQAAIKTVGDYVHKTGATGVASALPKSLRKILDTDYPKNDVK